jgi:hypothetical protein
MAIGPSAIDTTRQLEVLMKSLKYFCSSLACSIREGTNQRQPRLIATALAPKFVNP